MLEPGAVTIRILRSDAALQIAQYAQRLGVSQVMAARRLGVPQPTLSKIVNGRVSDISLELLIRIAVRAGLSLSLQTRRASQDSVSTTLGRAPRSRVSNENRDSLMRSQNLLSPSQRLEAFLEHSQHLVALRHAGRACEAQREKETRFTR